MTAPDKLPVPAKISRAQKAAAAKTASVLVEALPYIRRFRGKIVVVKYGGNALRAATDDKDKDNDRTTAAGGSGGDPLSSFAQDVVLMRAVGMLPVVVHGGGPQIGELMARLGKETEFRDGLRVTDADTLDIARMVLVGKVNRDIVSAINVHGPLAVGMSGEDAKLITAAPSHVDLGFVGNVSLVDPTMLQRLVAEGLIPVVATIGADESGQAYNINADTVAGALAEALQAEKLIFLTDTEGLRVVADDPSTVIHQASLAVVDEILRSGGAQGGMMPKVEACARAVRGGVGRAHILDGRVPHVLLLELFTDSGVGTMVMP
ncbi:MAG TPA: acetylglutamate kinase [Acidimicrobiales bacterium]